MDFNPELDNKALCDIALKQLFDEAGITDKYLAELFNDDSEEALQLTLSEVIP